MAKRRNKLYTNQKNAKSHDEGATAIMVQPIFMINKKVMIEAIVYPENLFFNFANENEIKANKLFDEINKKIQKSTDDLPYITEDDKKTEFLKYAISSVIYSYFGVEAYANTFIEHFLKQQQELQFETLQKKIDDIIPSVLQIKPFSKINKERWAKFLEIEAMRDQIVHSKYSNFNDPYDNWSNLLLSKLFNKKFFGCINICHEIVEYFKKHQPKNTSNVLNIGGRGLQAKPIK